MGFSVDFGHWTLDSLCVLMPSWNKTFDKSIKNLYNSI